MFELLEKIYVEVKGHTEQFKNVENRLDNLENDVKKIGAKMDRLQIDVNNISMKTTYNDSRIIEISKDLKKAK